MVRGLTHSERAGDGRQPGRPATPSPPPPPAAGLSYYEGVVSLAAVYFILGALFFLLFVVVNSAAFCCRSAIAKRRRGACAKALACLCAPSYWYLAACALMGVLAAVAISQTVQFKTTVSGAAGLRRRRGGGAAPPGAAAAPFNAPRPAPRLCRLTPPCLG